MPCPTRLLGPATRPTCSPPCRPEVPWPSPPAPQRQAVPWPSFLSQGRHKSSPLAPKGLPNLPTMAKGLGSAHHSCRLLDDVPSCHLASAPIPQSLLCARLPPGHWHSVTETALPCPREPHRGPQVAPAVTVQCPTARNRSSPWHCPSRKPAWTGSAHLILLAPPAGCPRMPGFPRAAAGDPSGLCPRSQVTCYLEARVPSSPLARTGFQFLELASDPTG